MEKNISPQLKVALVQTELYWKNKVANMAMLEEKIAGMDEEVDIIILPEMFTTGFTMEAEEVAENMNLQTTRWLKQMARHTQALVTGSFVVVEDGKYFNRLVWAKPNGDIGHYDKRHLFRMASEDEHYSMGKTQEFFEWKGWRIMPQVCYDLRFPVWSRNRLLDDGSLAYDLVFYVASWPSPRINAWDILLQARAVENLAYSIGVNRIGRDGNQVPYSGHSGAYNYKGETICFSQEKEEILIAELDYEGLMEFRKKFPAWRDSDRFELK
ncbi:amidohydrolase [Arthrospiribacter ruber]|uniref:Omega-amidase YafV n=1 Tax=Arthrospiribacter ruber TaxID=2487934 RepID=A0A951MIW9_9BACT|nr:amidohydrolase [Arthrospiribacter ruber]MBW3470515.1 amidohydrolase [Arthrospiribacter ruber]